MWRPWAAEEFLLAQSHAVVSPRCTASHPPRLSAVTTTVYNCVVFACVTAAPVAVAALEQGAFAAVDGAVHMRGSVQWDVNPPCAVCRSAAQPRVCILLHYSCLVCYCVQHDEANKPPVLGSSASLEVAAYLSVLAISLLVKRKMWAQVRFLGDA